VGRHAISAERIIMRDGLKCHYCRAYMNVYDKPNVQQQKDPKRFTFEHIVPKSHGGSYGLYNIVGACSKCNSHKGNSLFKCFCKVCINARVRSEMRELVEYDDSGNSTGRIRFR
jgi:hypothetical protein